MAPEKNETIEETVARLDERQKAQERREKARDSRVSYAIQVAEEAKDMVVKTNMDVALLPQTIVKEIKADARQAGLDRNGWIVILIAVASLGFQILDRVWP